MSGLGNVFDAVAAPEDAPRGPDLRVTAEVPRSALGRAQGVPISVPLVVMQDGEEIPRARDPEATGDEVRLHLSADLPDRATLRLRGQGGVRDGGAPGDLLLTIVVVDDPPARLGARGWIAISMLAAAGGSAITCAMLRGG